MAENTNDSAVLETEEELTSYTTETNAGAGTGDFHHRSGLRHRSS